MAPVVTLTDGHFILVLFFLFIATNHPCTAEDSMSSCLCVCACVHVCMCVPNMCTCIQFSKRGLRTKCVQILLSLNLNQCNTFMYLNSRKHFKANSNCFCEMRNEK